MRFQWHTTADVNEQFIGHWRELGRASCTPNVYLMPDFLLPAVRHLESGKAPLIAVVWSDDFASMLALAVLNKIAPVLKFPFPRLEAFRSRHSFQSGMLLRSGVESQVMDLLLTEVFKGP